MLRKEFKNKGTAHTTVTKKVTAARYVATVLLQAAARHGYACSRLYTAAAGAGLHVDTTALVSRCIRSNAYIELRNMS